jgi:hypothetical protein
MKYNTPIQDLIYKVQETLKTENHPIQTLVGNKLLELLKVLEDSERMLIEKSFEHGVGEGIDDPERPLTGKEYYQLRYGKGGNK